VQVDEGNVFLMKNIETGQYQSVEVYGVVCPQNDEVGAYEAREFSRKEALGQEFNVYVRKDLGFRQMASLVRLSDSQRYSKLLVSNGWATVRDEKETNVDP
jgi:endonuclease YncB( thermonuclease family)